MRTASFLRIASVALMVSVATPVLADSFFSGGTFWGDRSISMDPLRDESGLSVLGVDISAGGSSPQVAANYVAGLRPDQQARVLSGCSVMNPNTTTVNAQVVKFCRALNAGWRGGN